MAAVVGPDTSKVVVEQAAVVVEQAAVVVEQAAVVVVEQVLHHLGSTVPWSRLWYKTLIRS